MMKDNRKRDTHALNEEGMVLCNPRDKEASHMALMNDIQTSQDHKKITCKKCLKMLFICRSNCPPS